MASYRDAMVTGIVIYYPTTHSKAHSIMGGKILFYTIMLDDEQLDELYASSNEEPYWNK